MDNFMLEDELAERAIHKKQIAEKWEKYKLLSNTDDDPYTQLDLAVVLENQRLFNESQDGTGDNAQFKRISIPMVMQIWKNLIVRKVACVQPLLEKKDAFYHLEHEGNSTSMQKTEVEAQAWKMKAVWAYEAQQDGRRSYNGLDWEAELTAVLATEIGMELDRRAITIMRNNAGTKWGWDFNRALGDTIKEKYESLYIELIKVAQQIDFKGGRGEGNWIITSPEIASIFETSCSGFYPSSSDSFTSSLGINYVGFIGGRFKLYKDPLFPTSQILMGYKGNHPYDSPFVWCPHTMIRQTPVFLDPDSFTPRKGLMMTDASRITPGGESLLATVAVSNFIF